MDGLKDYFDAALDFFARREMVKMEGGFKAAELEHQRRQQAIEMEQNAQAQLFDLQRLALAAQERAQAATTGEWLTVGAVLVGGFLLYKYL